MAAGATITPPSFLGEVRRRLDRAYTFATAPATLRNTFAGATITNKPPGVAIVSAGAVIENNKLCELQVESADVLNGAGFEGPGITAQFDFPCEFFCQMFAYTGVMGTADRTKVNNKAFAGIELGSPGIANLTANPQSGSVQLRQRLDDYSQFEFVRHIGGGAAPLVVPFTVPQINSHGAGGSMDPNYSDGHQLGIVWDPWGLVATAFVDGIARAQFSIAIPNTPQFFTSTDLLSAGVFVSSGTQSAAVAMTAAFWSPRVTSYDTNRIGSGLI